MMGPCMHACMHACQPRLTGPEGQLAFHSGNTPVACPVSSSSACFTATELANYECVQLHKHEEHGPIVQQSDNTTPSLDHSPVSRTSTTAHFSKPCSTCQLWHHLPVTQRRFVFSNYDSLLFDLLPLLLCIRPQAP